MSASLNATAPLPVAPAFPGPTTRDFWVLVAGLAMQCGALYVDALTPVGTPEWAFYTVPIALALLQHRVWPAYLLGLGTMLGLSVGLVLSAPGPLRHTASRHQPAHGRGRWHVVDPGLRQSAFTTPGHASPLGIGSGLVGEAAREGSPRLISPVAAGHLSLQ